ncbi:MAG TPA: VanZ family protein [Gemmatimonadales bacterium]|nr:VanZ family protein [Gemmatimonadales bacterium]
MRSRIGGFLVITGLLAIAALTLVPIPEQSSAAQETPLWCLVCGDYGGVDVINNVLLFVPFGAGLWLWGRSFRSVLVVGALLSLAIESLQLLIIAGRDASLSDLLTNTLGSWVGARVASHREGFLRPATSQALRLALGGGLAWIAVQSASAVLLRPWVPESAMYGAWGRDIPGRDRFDGRVTAASVAGIVIPPSGTTLGQELASRLRHGQVRLEVELVTGENRSSWSPVLEVRDRTRTVLALQAVGRDLVFEPAARSHLLRLRRPAIRMRRALPAQPGTPVQITAGRRADTLWGVWNGAGRIGQSVQGLSPSFGWSLVTPVQYAFGRGVRLITGAWLALWLVPFGYWSAGASEGRLRGMWLPGLLLVSGLALIAGLLGYPASHWSEWLAGLVGLGLGWAAWRRAAYIGRRCDSPSTSESY